MTVENMREVIVDLQGCHWAYSSERRKIYCLEADTEHIEIIADKMFRQEEITKDDLYMLVQNGYYCDSWEEGFKFLCENGYF